MKSTQCQCANCGGFESTHVMTVRDEFGSTFAVVKCTFCSLVYADFGQLFANNDDYSRQVYQPRATCPYCGSNSDTTTTKRITLETAIRRYHHCRKCAMPFTTYENRRRIPND